MKKKGGKIDIKFLYFYCIEFFRDIEFSLSNLNDFSIYQLSFLVTDCTDFVYHCSLKSY